MIRWDNSSGGVISLWSKVLPDEAVVHVLSAILMKIVFHWLLLLCFVWYLLSSFFFILFINSIQIPSHFEFEYDFLKKYCAVRIIKSIQDRWTIDFSLSVSVCVCCSIDALSRTLLFSCHFFLCSFALTNGHARTRLHAKRPTKRSSIWK